MDKIVTEYWSKPIPTNKFDWMAYFDGDEPDDDGRMLTGSGATEYDAIEDLIDGAETAERISEEDANEWRANNGQFGAGS